MMEPTTKRTPTLLSEEDKMLIRSLNSSLNQMLQQNAPLSDSHRGALEYVLKVLGGERPREETTHDYRIHSPNPFL